MKVKYLIELLQKQDPGLDVFIRDTCNGGGEDYYYLMLSIDGPDSEFGKDEKSIVLNITEEE